MHCTGNTELKRVKANLDHSYSSIVKRNRNQSLLYLIHMQLLFQTVVQQVQVWSTLAVLCGTRDDIRIIVACMYGEVLTQI